MKYLSSFIDWWRRTYNKQGRAGKLTFSCLSLFMLCCLCSIPIGVFAPSNSNATLRETTTNTPLPTFDASTPTPIPPTPVPPTPTIQLDFTDTPIPHVETATPTETQIVLPTATTEPTSSGPAIVIVAVNKSAEYVDIKNTGNEAVNLNGWVLVSERGNQRCGLGGVIQPNEILRIWAMSGDTGYSCGYSTNIWNNSESDPAVLYNPQGQEVSRY